MCFQTQESIKTPFSSSESMGFFVIVDSSNDGDDTNDLSGISAKGSLIASLLTLLEESLKSTPKKCF